MPLYNFKCGKCGKEKELVLKMQERNSIVNCDCGYTMNRCVDKSSFKLEGGGWFNHGYQNPLK